MKKSLFQLLFCLSLTGVSLPIPAHSAAPLSKLAQTWADEETGSKVDRHLRSRAQQFQFVLVAGIFNETLRPGIIPGLENRELRLLGLDLKAGYFEDNRRSLIRELGVKPEQISHIFPNSLRSVSENADLLYSDFVRIHQQSGRPLIVIGHSKGAAETLLALLRHPELATGSRLTVSQAILLNGSIGGSPIADFLTRKTELRRRNPGAYSATLEAAGTISRNLVTFAPDRLAVDWPGLESIGTASSRTLFRLELRDLKRRLKELHASRAEAVFSGLSNRIFYVRGYDASQTLSNNSQRDWAALAARGKGISASLVSSYLLMNASTLYPGFGLAPSVPNDGMVFVSDQYLPGIGRVLGTFAGADHAALVNGSQVFVTNKGAAYKRSFTRALLRQLIY